LLRKEKSQTGAQDKMKYMTSIRLFTCVTLSLDEELQVLSGDLPKGLEGCTSHDQMVGPVKQLLESHHLPWSETFVSLFVLLPSDETTALHEAFGYPFELNVDEVIPDVVLVCSEDAQNWVRRTTSPRAYFDLTDMASQAKVEILLEARNQSDNKRAEARMNRALRLSDVRVLSSPQSI
jgi:hypothetical protein